MSDPKQLSRPKQPDLIQKSGTLSSIIHPHPSHNDPLGSYTGLPIDADVPVQDVDDL